ncbi:MAG TPA: lactate utilization protein [Phycisphaerae bacterium]|nr:lactate utilization protein [Phycisphaerae bacterium]
MTAECTREMFLRHVRQAIGQPGEPIPLPDPAAVARVVKPDADLVGLFLKRVEEAKMSGYRVGDEAGVASKVVEIASAASAKTAIVPEEDIPGRDRIVSTLQDKGIRLLDVNDHDAAFDADVGITGAAWAVAETASVSLLSGGPRRRLASLAVPCSIVVVRVGQIVADLLDWAAAQPADLPACQVLVSGPSKTADIELVLVIGVHGPKEQHIIVVG